MPIGPLLTVFSFLLCRTATVCTSDVFLLLGLCLHFVRSLVVARPLPKDYASFKNVVKIISHVLVFCGDYVVY